MTLGLETNARLPMGAVATPLSDEKSDHLPTPVQSAAAIEELVLLYVGRAPLPSKPFDDYVSHITAALWHVALAGSEDVRAAVGRLVDGGRLVHDVARIGSEGAREGSVPRECPVLRLAPAE